MREFCFDINWNGFKLFLINFKFKLISSLSLLYKGKNAPKFLCFPVIHLVDGMNWTSLALGFILAFKIKTTLSDSNNLNYLTKHLNLHLQSIDQVPPHLIAKFQWSNEELKDFLLDTLRLCAQYVTSGAFNQHCKSNFDSILTQIEPLSEYQYLKDKLSALLLPATSLKHPAQSSKKKLSSPALKLLQLKQQFTKLIIENLLKIGPGSMENVDYFLFYLMFTVYVGVGGFFSVSWAKYYLEFWWRREKRTIKS